MSSLLSNFVIIICKLGLFMLNIGLEHPNFITEINLFSGLIHDKHHVVNRVKVIYEILFCYFYYQLSYD